MLISGHLDLRKTFIVNGVFSLSKTDSIQFAALDNSSPCLSEENISFFVNALKKSRKEKQTKKGLRREKKVKSEVRRRK